MYARLWRALPGPTWLRTLLAVVAVLLVVALLFTVVFPALSDLLALDDATVG